MGNLSYKSQTCTIALGLASVVTGIVFFLISAGVSAPMWKVLGGAFAAAGTLLTMIGGTWCFVSVRRDKKANPRGFYAHPSRADMDEQTMCTSEATWANNHS